MPYLDPRKCLSSASLAWKLFLKNTPEANILCNYKSDVLKKFVWKSISGGRVMCYKGRWERQNENESIFPFDANSLYVSVMCDESLTFPDIRETKILDQPNLEELNLLYKHYIIECDIFIPEHIKFIPIATKKEGQNGCFYKYGWFYSQFYNDCDIKEALKVGIKIIKIHKALAFKKCINNILAPFSQIIYNERDKVKDHDEILGDLYKLIGNSIYGKLVCRDVEEGLWFTTFNEIKKHYLDKNLIDYKQLANKEWLIRYKIDKEMAYIESDPRNEDLENQQAFPSIIGSYVLANSWKIMNNFIHAINGFKELKVYYTDTDSLYSTNDSLKILEKSGYGCWGLGQGKNDINKILYFNC